MNSLKAYGATVKPSVKNPEETPVPSVRPPEKDVQSNGPHASKPGLKTAYLTFDDGPSIETTPEILEPKCCKDGWFPCSRLELSEQRCRRVKKLYLKMLKEPQ